MLVLHRMAQEYAGFAITAKLSATLCVLLRLGPAFVLGVSC